MDKLIRRFIALFLNHRCIRCGGKGEVATGKAVGKCPKCHGTGFICWRCGRPMQGIVDDSGRLVDSNCWCER